MARAASALSPTMRTTRPARVLANAHHSAAAQATPTKNSALTSSAARSWGDDDQKPSEIDGSIGALGWMYGLPKKNARPMPSNIMAMPSATSLTRGSLQSQPCRAPNSDPTSPAASTPIHGEPECSDTA